MNTKKQFVRTLVLTVSLSSIAGCAEPSLPFYRMVQQEIPAPEGFGGKYAPPSDGLVLSSYEKLYVTSLNTPVNWDLSNLVPAGKAPFHVESMQFVGTGQGEMRVENLERLSGVYTPAFNFRGRERVQLEVSDTFGGRHNFKITLLVQSLVHEIQPALAIRATGCIMCHAQVDSNIVTDFGYGFSQGGKSLYFGQNTPGLGPNSGSIYGDHGGNWGMSDVSGRIYVPAAQMPASYWGSYKLVDYVKAQIPSGWQVPAPGESKPKTDVKEVQSLFIGAPTIARIRQLGGWNANDSTMAVRFYPQDTNQSPALSGIRISDSGAYYQNIEGQDIVCEGDVVINGVLFLKNASFKTSNSGCRFYVSESVFVMNSFTFPGNAPYRNVQISSSRAIVLGVGPDSAGADSGFLKERMINHWTHGGFHTRDESLTTEQKNAVIYQQSRLLPDYTDCAVHGRAQAFERALFNAPQFHSRYQGHVSAVIIAEVGLAALGEFKFEFSPVFSGTQVLPLLEPEEYLSF